MSQSNVHRHQQAIKRRTQYPESEFWESEAGSGWLRLLVYGSIFFFGIKHGIGVAEISQFLKALRLGLHVGCSPSALATLKEQMKETIRAYEAAQAEHCHPQEGQGIGVGSDEVFFGLPVLVLMELGSGYIFTEVQNYRESIRTISLSLHPFDLERQEAQTLSDLETTLLTPLEHLRTLAQTYGGAKAIQAIERFEKQLPEIAPGIHAWWLWAIQALATKTASVDLQNWVMTTLLPWVYWLQQTDKISNVS